MHPATHTRYTRVAAACLLAACGSLAQAGMPLSRAFYRGSDTAPAGTLAATTQISGDQAHTLSYSFTATSQVASAALQLSWQGGSHVRLRLRAPATARLVLAITDWAGNQRFYPVSRGNAPVDASGWETQTVQIAPVSTGVGILELQVLAPASLPSQDAAGSVSFRGVELWNGAPPAGAVPNYDETVKADKVTVAPVSAPGTTVAPEGYFTGDDFLKVGYDFRPAGRQVAGALLAPAAPTPASYVRFRVWAPAAAPLLLKVTPSGGAALPVIAVDASHGVPEGTGWVSYVVPLGASPVNVQNLALYTQKAAGAPDQGSLYIKDVELRDHAPTAHEPLAPLQPISVSAGAQGTDKGATLDEYAWTSAGDTSFRYNFSAAGGGAFAASTLTLSQPVKANRLRFLAKVPAGVPLVVRFQDELDQAFEAKLFKPLATVDDAGWVPYTLKLEPVGNPGATSVGRIKKISLRIERAMNNSNITTVSRQEPSVVPIDRVQFKQLTLSNEPDQLDLAPGTPTLAGGGRARGSDVWPILGVATRDPVGDLSHAQELGLSHMRFAMTWSDVERTGGALDLTARRAHVDAVLAPGMKVVLLLAYNNTAYSQATWTASDHGGIPPEATRNLTAYLNYAKAVVQAYKGNPKVTFEIWNEPNIPSFWQPAKPLPTMAAEYANLLTQTVDAVLHDTVDPQAKVVSGGVTRIDFPYLNAVSRTAALARVAGVGMHPYTDGYPESSADEAAGIVAAMRTHAPAGRSLAGLQAWVTELGQSSGKLRGAVTNDGADPANRRMQANLVARQILTSWSTSTPLHVIYRLRDLYSNDAGFDAEQANYGLFSVAYPSGPAGQWTDKPAARAVRTLKYVARDRRYQGMVTGSPSSLQAMKFSAPGLETVYAVWVNATGSQASVTTLPSCNPNLNLDGSPRSTAGSCVVDMENQPVACAPGANGRLVCPVSELGGPIYVRVGGT
ncbi:MAG: hypothetical protein EPO01_21275 [Aquabacterium sp.]|nr:MAG: hypothetical protein EPO01_21275 [Aquabacterium sp.]